MKWSAPAVLLLAFGLSGAARAAAPLYDPAVLNIGLNCQWQPRCMSDQQRAMKRVLKYVAKYRPPVWRVQQCNRNAARQRGGIRVDWVGFSNCVRNASLQYFPPPAPGRKRSVKQHRRVHRHRQLKKRR